MDDNEELAHLLAEARKGDTQALGDLLERLRGWVRQCAHSRLGQGLGARVDGSDIAQVVNIQVWKSFDQFRGHSVPELLGWIKEILQNAITDCIREHGADKRDPSLEVPGGDLFSGVAADATTPSQGAIRNEQHTRLSEALQQLSPMQQRVFCLRLYEGLPFEEVARRLDVTVGNARVLMVRATERLKNELGDEHE